MAIEIKQWQNYPGLCCEGWDWTIRLIFPNPPGYPIEETSVWGRCDNPECPRCQGEDDIYRGVRQLMLDDFEEWVKERGVEVVEPEVEIQTLEQVSA